MAILVIVLILALGAWAYWGRAATQGELRLYGTVDIREVTLAFRVGGRLATVNVDEGTTVRAGEVLAQLDPGPLQNSLQAATANLAAVQARNALLRQGYKREDIEQARANLQGRQAALAEADKQVARQRDLVPTGAAPQRVLDSAQAQRDQADAHVKAAKEQLASLSKGYRKEEIAESDAMVQSAGAALEAAKLNLQDATLKTPTDGMILTRAVEPGSMLAAGNAVLSLSLTHPVWARAYVGEKDLGAFATGTKVLLLTDSRPGKPYHGTVGFVSPTAEFTPKNVETADLRTALVYRLRVTVQDADAAIRQGMPVTLHLDR